MRIFTCQKHVKQRSLTLVAPLRGSLVAPLHCSGIQDLMVAPLDSSGSSRGSRVRIRPALWGRRWYTEERITNWSPPPCSQRNVVIRPFYLHVSRSATDSETEFGCILDHLGMLMCCVFCRSAPNLRPRTLVSDPRGFMSTEEETM